MKNQGDELRGTTDLLDELTKSTSSDQRNAPSLACMLPPWNFKRKNGGLTLDEQLPEAWISKLKERAEFEVTRWFNSETMILLVCSQTFRLVPCGPNGQGYKTSHTQKWARSTGVLVASLLQITCDTLGKIFQRQPLASNAMGHTGEVVTDNFRPTVVLELKSKIENIVASEFHLPLGQHEDHDSKQSVSTIGRGVSGKRGKVSRETFPRATPGCICCGGYHASGSLVRSRGSRS